MSPKRKTPRPLGTVKGVKDVLTNLESSPNCREGQEKISASDDARFRQQQMLEAQVDKAYAASGKLQAAIESGDLSHPAVAFCYRAGLDDVVPEIPETEEDRVVAALLLTQTLIESETSAEGETDFFFRMGWREIPREVAQQRQVLGRVRRAAAVLYGTLGWDNAVTEGLVHRFVQSLEYRRWDSC